MVHHPLMYARLLAKKINENNSCCWLVNTGWTGGPYGVGKRMKIANTRAMVDALLSGALADANYDVDPFFGLLFPKSCPGVQAVVMNPRNTWPNTQEYGQQAYKLAGMFVKNFEKYAEGVSAQVIQASPKG